MSNDAFEHILGKPIMLEFQEYVAKIRNRLLIICIISISLIIGGLDVNLESRIFGLKFNGLNERLIYTGLLISTWYLLLHFIWCALDSFMEWRVRITGTCQILANRGSFSSLSVDNPENPRHSTLYNWWLERATQYGSAAKKIEELSDELNSWLDSVPDSTPNEDAQTRQVFSNELNTIRSNLLTLINHINDAKNMPSNPRLTASLSRFDKFYILMLRSQNLRWLMIELLLPIILGASSIYLLHNEVFRVGI